MKGNELQAPDSMNSKNQAMYVMLYFIIYTRAMN